MESLRTHLCVTVCVEPGCSILGRFSVLQKTRDLAVFINNLLIKTAKSVILEAVGLRLGAAKDTGFGGFC